MLPQRKYRYIEYRRLARFPYPDANINEYLLNFEDAEFHK